MEESSLYIRRDADSAIGNFEPDDDGVRQVFLKKGLNHHVTLFRKLDRIADEVRENLPEPPRIAAQTGRYGRVHQSGDFQPFGLRPFRELTQDIFYRRAKIEVDTFQFQFAGFDLAVLKNIVNQVE